MHCVATRLQIRLPMFVTVIVFGMLTKLFLSSLLVYRTSLWWVPAVGLIVGGLALGLLAHRQALALCAVAVGVPAMYVTHRFRRGTTTRSAALSARA